MAKRKARAYETRAKSPTQQITGAAFKTEYQGWRHLSLLAARDSLRDVRFPPNASAQSRLNTTEANQPVAMAIIAVARP